MSGRMADNPDPPPDTEGIKAADQYKEAMNNLRLGVSMLWEAFKTYFTISTILFTAFAFLNTREVSSSLPCFGRVSLSIGVAAIGILISALGPFAIRRFIQYQERHLKFARRLERGSEKKLIATIRKVWGNDSVGAPRLTSWVFAAFGALWLIALIALLVPVIRGAPCAPVSTADSGAARDGDVR